VSNVLPFPRPAVGHGPAREGPAHEGPSPGHESRRTHAVQFYDTEACLFSNVARYLAAGLEAGEQLLVIATPEHRDGFLRHLGRLGIEPSTIATRLTSLDARGMLEKFMVGGMPDADLFSGVLAGVMAEIGARDPSAGICAYGEMVDLLCQDGNAKAAIRLEELWNHAAGDYAFGLLCGYLATTDCQKGDAAWFAAVCSAHAEISGAATFSNAPDHRELEIGLLQRRAHSLEQEVYQRRELEAALREALSQRRRVEDELRASLKREQAARAAAEASDSFKEMFLAILGHDLRNPLNIILTTAKLMTMRDELAAQSRKRIDRVIASGERMQRMIEQLLDVTRARLADGILVDRGSPCDVGALVAKVIGEVRTANPERIIELDVGPCIAPVDQDRFEQVVSNLVTNAVVHGDASRPIRVQVAPHGTYAQVIVQNHGPPIRPTLLPHIFAPFIRAHDAEHGSFRGPGLGLGLFISERIVSAHGGKLEVQSEEGVGTTFAAYFPLA
jgi:signal transduction histidine kinase